MSFLKLSLLFAGLAKTSPTGNPLLESNIAYKSPSLYVRELEVPTYKVSNRLAKRASTGYWTGNVSFPYGIASGDPEQDSVVLWTHPVKTGGSWTGNDLPPVCLQWMVSESSDFNSSSIVASGQAQTTWEVDYSFKVIATGLRPYTKYSYVFQNCASAKKGQSPVGTFKTLPSPTADVDSIKIAFFSCSNYPNGFFNAYGDVANNSDAFDWVEHMGDYQYEGKPPIGPNVGAALGRLPNPNRELVTLQDYRDRYASYRTDPDLANLHQRVAWQAVWDDHEVADNTWKGGSADSNDTAQGTIRGVNFSQRKANAVRAYFEWMPIRQVDTDDKLRIWRTFQIGKLATMLMLDTRQYDRDITDVYYNTDEVAALSTAQDRSIMGPKQEQWFYDSLKESQQNGTTWKLVMQQVVFAHLNTTAQGGGAEDYDAWDGYFANRQRILDTINNNKIENVIVASGDSHASWVSDIVYDSKAGYNPKTGEGALGVEFAGSAVSSSSSYGARLTPARYKAAAQKLTAANSELQYAEGQLRGYVALTITPKSLIAEYRGFPNQTTRAGGVTMATFAVDVGTNRLRRPLNGGNPVQYGSLGAGAGTNSTGSS